MNIVLTPGLWLDGSAWDAVAERLRERGHDPVPVTLAGQGDGDTDASLDDQVLSVCEAIDDAVDTVMLVGHSAACTLVWMAADRRAGQVERIVLIDGAPQPHGEAYAPWFDVAGDAVPFPGWEPFAGPDIDDLDEATRARIEANSHPVPAEVATGTVLYTDPARKLLPVTVIFPEHSADRGRAMINDGEVPELEGAAVDIATIPAGHWPMFSQPEKLADLLADLAD